MKQRWMMILMVAAMTMLAGVAMAEVPAAEAQPPANEVPAEVAEAHDGDAVLASELADESLSVLDGADYKVSSCNINFAAYTAAGCEMDCYSLGCGFDHYVVSSCTCYCGYTL